LQEIWAGKNDTGKGLFIKESDTVSLSLRGVSIFLLHIRGDRPLKKRGEGPGEESSATFIRLCIPLGDDA
jgi:hypothetical protein